MKQLYRIIFIIGFIAIFGLVVAYARGYRIDLNKKTMTSTGIMAFTSYPKAAKIYINGVLKGVTDTNVTLPPGSYKVEIKKDGFTSWSKQINLKGELVATIDPVLFPQNPTLSPLTNLGIIKAIPITDSEKILIFVQNDASSDDVVDETINENKDGIYIFESGKRPLPFFQPLKPIVLKQNLIETVDFKTTTVTISPDLKEAIFEFGEKDNQVVYLMSLDEENKTPFNITASYQTLIEAWNKEKYNNNQKVLETFPPEFAKVASDSTTILGFAPNDTKVLYQANTNIEIPLIIKPSLIAANQTEENRNLIKDNIYVYDKKEDKNYLITNDQSLTTNQQIQWYFDSKHLLINEGKKIVVVDYDGSNKQTVYSGPYDSSFFIQTADGKLVLLSNLNPEANPYPDLYLVGTR